MRRTLFRSWAVGTAIFIALLGVGLWCFSPAFELLLVSSLPVIYLVGPLVNLMAADSLEGPPGGVVIILLSAWIELCLLTMLSDMFFSRWRTRSLAQTKTPATR